MSLLSFVREAALVVMLRVMRAKANSKNADLEGAEDIEPFAARTKFRRLAKREERDKTPRLKTGPVARAMTRANWGVPLSALQTASFATCEDLSDCGSAMVRNVSCSTTSNDNCSEGKDEVD